MTSSSHTPAPPFVVAVSIVAYNTPPEDLKKLLQQLSFSNVPHRVIVVDNSEMDTLRSIATFAGVEYRYQNKNIGFGAAHNIAIRETVDEAVYHAVINPDISFTSDVLRELYDFMEVHPDIGQVMPAICNPDGTEQRLAKRLPTPIDLFARRFLGTLGELLMPHASSRYETRDLDLSQSREIPFLSGCFMFLRTSVLRQVGVFDEDYFLYMEDVDLCRRVGAISQTVIYPKTSVMHGYHKGSYRKIGLLVLHLRAAFHYFWKWGWILDRERAARNRECGGLVE